MNASERDALPAEIAKKLRKLAEHIVFWHTQHGLEPDLVVTNVERELCKVLALGQEQGRQEAEAYFSQLPKGGWLGREGAGR